MRSAYIYTFNLSQLIYFLLIQFMSAIKAELQYQDQVDEIYQHVLKNNLEAVRQILKKHPCLANKIYKSQTLLDYPCRHGKAQMVKLLIDCGVEVNNCNKIGSPPLLYAIAFNNFDIVKILCQNKAKVEGIIVQENLTMIDLAVLHGRYDSATYIYNLLSNKTLKKPEEYAQVAKKYSLRYVNYPVFIDGVVNGKSIQEVDDFLTKPKTKEGGQDEESCCCCSCFSFMFSSKQEEKVSKGENPEEEVDSERKMSGSKK